MLSSLQSIASTYKFLNIQTSFAYRLQAHLAIDISNATQSQFTDSSGNGTWTIYEGTSSTASITSGSSSTEWTGGTQMVKYIPNISDYFWRYTFDTNTYSGTTFYDVNGQNAGTLTSATIDTTANNQPPSFGNGVLNMTITTPATNYATLPSFVPNMSAGTTLSFWLLVTTSTAASSCAISFSLANNQNGLFSVSKHVTLTSLVFTIYNSTGTTFTSTNCSYTASTYAHYVWVINPNGTWNIYVNGVLNTTTSGNNYLTNQTYAANYLGRTYTTSTSSFDGKLDDFSVYKRALTADEAYLIYTNAQTGIYYPFETTDVSGTTVANNMVTKIYDGTLLGSPSVATVVADYGSRIPGKGYLSLSSSISQYYKFKPVNITSNGFTFATWFRSNNSSRGSARLFDMRSGEISIAIGSSTSNNAFRLQVTSGPAANFDTTPLNMNNNTWYHMALTVTNNGASSVYTIYVNGVSVGTATGNYPALGYRTYNNIGNYQDGLSSGGERLNGGVDDFQYYYRALNAFEVNYLYNSTYNVNNTRLYIGSATIGNTLPAWSTVPATNYIFASETGYTVKPNEITLCPSGNNTYCAWTCPKTSTYAIDVSYADYGVRGDGTGFQIFTVNSDTTFKQLLYARTVTSTALTNSGGSYLSIPRYETSLSVGDKIILRSDMSGNPASDASVLSALIYEKIPVGPPNAPTVVIFSYTGFDQTITIPTNINGNVNIKCWGAGGGTQGYGALGTMFQTGWGGGGGYTEANFTQASMAGQTLTIIVGQGGQTINNKTQIVGTYGGGGGQNQNWVNDVNWGAASGGGRSAVRLSNNVQDISTNPIRYLEIITAGGGGGGGGTRRSDTTSTAGVGSGGPGGGLTGGNGQYALAIPGAGVNADTSYNGLGGTPTAAGAIGNNSLLNTAGTIGGQFYGGFGAAYGGGGGGGYYGGGCGGISYTGGTNQFIFGGGGGGSSYVHPLYGTQVYMLQGSNDTVAGTSFFPSGYTSSSIGNGGAQQPTNKATNGNPGLPGLVVITYTLF